MTRSATTKEIEDLKRQIEVWKQRHNRMILDEKYLRHEIDCLKGACSEHREWRAAILTFAAMPKNRQKIALKRAESKLSAVKKQNNANREKKAMDRSRARAAVDLRRGHRP